MLNRHKIIREIYFYSTCLKLNYLINRYRAKGTFARGRAMGLGQGERVEIYLFPSRFNLLPTNATKSNGYKIRIISDLCEKSAKLV